MADADGMRPEPAEGCPDIIAGLDLSQSGLLEASAGTGKTYAIEHLVLRLLVETPDLELPSILVLTFTEKAAGELKDKIRSRLGARLAQGGLPPAARERLRRAHLEFDRASIHTIHGFCQRVLRRYAFETRSLFDQELLPDVSGALELALYDEMRSTWLAEFETGGMDAFRALAADLNLGARTRWSKPLFDIARQFNPERGDRLLPEYSPERAAAAEAEMGAALAEAGRFASAASGRAGEDHPFLVLFRAIPSHTKNTRQKGPALIAECIRLSIVARGADGEDNAEERLRLAGELLAAGRSAFAIGFKAKGFGMLLPEEAQGMEEYRGLRDFLEALERMRRAEAERERERSTEAFALRRRIILDLRERLRSWLREKGYLTYDGMIEDLCMALRADPGRAAWLRRDYRYCLVDEFQDTDPLQWEIFRRVFLQSGGSNPLWLIGDPKQAIYRFRGGDIHTYMDARGEMFALSREGRAQGRGLDTNYRSGAALVEACNAAFLHASWFRSHPVDPADTAWRLPAAPDPLGYVPVAAGNLPVQRAQDAVHGGRPVVLKDFSVDAPGGKGAVRRRLARWIAGEILALVSDPEGLRVPDKASGTLRPAAWGDICILVRERKQADFLQRVLTDAGIPARTTRSLGLYKSDAALQYQAVLESLEDPADAGKHARALLTRFLRPEGDPPPAGPPASPHPLFEDWLRLAGRRRWPGLFHSLLHAGGMIYRESLRPDADRSLMDFIHIGQNLVQEALRDNLGLSGLIQRLRDLRSSSGADDDTDLRREDSDGGKVALMTMHVSKGLEFPVVFLAAWSGNPGASFLKYRSGPHTVFNLDTKDETAKRHFREEAEGDDRRLLYVALTRARYKLYAPLMPAPRGKTDYGALGGFVADALRAAAAARPDLYARLPDEDYSRPPEPLPVPGAAESARSAAASAATVDPGASGSLVPAVPADKAGSGGFPDAADRAGHPVDGPDAARFDSPRQSLPQLDYAGYPAENALARVDLARRRRRMASYSLLTRRAHAFAAEDVEGRFDKDESAGPEAGTPAAPPGDDAPGSRPPGDALPGGKEIGNLLHEILEDLDFAAAGSVPSPEALLASAPARDRIEYRMAGHRLAPDRMPEVAALAWNAVNALLPDPAGGEPFRLADVAGADRRAEMEFLFPYPALPGKGGPDGYIGGFIDLVFRRGGRYYLLDWKSNRLDGYGSAQLAHSMSESRYDDQYRLYTLALDRWLAGLVPDYAYETHFGGIYYLYLRGIRPEAPGEGVFALRPSAAEVRAGFPRSLSALLSEAGLSGRIDAAALFPEAA